MIKNITLQHLAEAQKLYTELYELSLELKKNPNNFDLEVKRNELEVQFLKESEAFREEPINYLVSLKVLQDSLRMFFKSEYDMDAMLYYEDILRKEDKTYARCLMLKLSHPLTEKGDVYLLDYQPDNRAVVDLSEILFIHSYNKIGKAGRFDQFLKYPDSYIPYIEAIEEQQRIDEESAPLSV